MLLDWAPVTTCRYQVRRVAAGIRVPEIRLRVIMGDNRYDTVDETIYKKSLGHVIYGRRPRQKHHLDARRVRTKRTSGPFFRTLAPRQRASIRGNHGRRDAVNRRPSFQPVSQHRAHPLRLSHRLLDDRRTRQGHRHHMVRSKGLSRPRKTLGIRSKGVQ